MGLQLTAPLRSCRIMARFAPFSAPLTHRLHGGVAQWLGRHSLAGGLSWYMPDLWLTCDHFVGKVSAISTNQAFHPSGVGKWLVGRRSVCGRTLSLRPTCCTPAVSATSAAPLQLRYAACGAIQCYMPLPSVTKTLLTCRWLVTVTLVREVTTVKAALSVTCWPPRYNHWTLGSGRPRPKQVTLRSSPGQPIRSASPLESSTDGRSVQENRLRLSKTNQTLDFEMHWLLFNNFEQIESTYFLQRYAYCIFTVLRLY